VWYSFQKHFLRIKKLSGLLLKNVYKSVQKHKKSVPKKIMPSPVCPFCYGFFLLRDQATNIGENTVLNEMVREKKIEVRSLNDAGFLMLGISEWKNEEESECRNTGRQEVRMVTHSKDQ
jgi:hypothetical protein